LMKGTINVSSLKFLNIRAHWSSDL